LPLFRGGRSGDHSAHQRVVVADDHAGSNRTQSNRIQSSRTRGDFGCRLLLTNSVRLAF
jgi:hypothetical protein